MKKLALFALMIVLAGTIPVEGATTISAVLSWQDNSNNEDGFNLERGPTAAGPFSPVAKLGPNVTAYTDTPLTPSTQYCYRVRAFNAVGPSGYSNIACGTTSAAGTVPTSPAGLALKFLVK